jgi:two-component system cell cycle response regulator
MQISSAIKGALLFEQQKETEKQLKEANTELESLSLMDDLTRLYNRRGFFTLCDQMLKMARREQIDCILIYMDLDGLKKINDTFGHSEGDEAIKVFAGIIRRIFRSNDIMARIGGDEFIILSYNAMKKDMESIKNKLIEAIAHYNSSSGKQYSLSVSMGFACFKHQSNVSLAGLIKTADHELYANKKNKKD